MRNISPREKYIDKESFKTLLISTYTTDFESVDRTKDLQYIDGYFASMLWQGYRKIFMVVGGRGKLSKNFDHHGWSTTKNFEIILNTLPNLTRSGGLHRSY